MKAFLKKWWLELVIGAAIVLNIAVYVAGSNLGAWFAWVVTLGYFLNAIWERELRAQGDAEHRNTFKLWMRDRALFRQAQGNGYDAGC